jgi:rhodanese-related sulfurtransferase
MKLPIRQLILLSTLLLALSVMAEEVVVGETAVIGLTADKPFLHVIHDGRSIKVQRVQDPEYELKGYFAKTGRKCPPFCIQPEQVDPRIATIGELEVFDFMENELRDNKGLLIDARTPEWYQRGTIPGSINMPFTTFNDPNSTEIGQALELCGAVRRVDVGAFTRKLEEMGIMGGDQKTDQWDFRMPRNWCYGAMARPVDSPPGQSRACSKSVIRPRRSTTIVVACRCGNCGA